jgi:diacylglycerol kinase (ATP)
MQCALIVNPVAGHGRAERNARLARAAWESAGWNVTTAQTQREGHATELAREVAASGPDLVVACGGDGTVTEALAGLWGTGIPLGLLPAGTGNDLARMVGLPLDAETAARELLTGAPTRVDCLRVNQQQLCLNVTGLGFDAGVCERINRRRRWLGGTPAYLVAVAQGLVDFRPTRVRVSSDGGAWEGAALLVAIANARSYGGGMRIAPEALLDDGLADVVIVAYTGRIEFLKAFRRVFNGTVLSHRLVTWWRARGVRVETEGPSPVLVDGDLKATTPLDVRVEPGAALMWLPASFGR